GTGVCIGGAKAASACADASACPGGQCVHCVVQGGAAIPGDATHHCAANCTFETDITYNLEQGVLTQDGTGIASGSGAVVHGDTLTIPLALSGQSQQTLSAGKPSSDGKVPFVIKAASIKYPPIPVQNLACACVRGEPAKTCGGTIFEADGVTQALDCSDNFTAGASVCTSAGKNPCAFVHGDGNAGTGLIGCGAGGLDGTDITITQDDLDGSCAGGASACTSPPKVTLGGHGPMGSATALLSIAI